MQRWVHWILGVAVKSLGINEKMTKTENKKMADKKGCSCNLICAATTWEN